MFLTCHNKKRQEVCKKVQKIMQNEHRRPKLDGKSGRKCTRESRIERTHHTNKPMQGKSDLQILIIKT